MFLSLIKTTTHQPLGMGFKTNPAPLTTFFRRLGNGTDYIKRSVEVESMESLDDPDDFFGCVPKESTKKTE